MATNEIRYRFGSQAKYDAYLSYDDNIVFFCTDTGKMYRGAVDMTSSVRLVSDHASVVNPARNVLYFDNAGMGWVYYKNAETNADEWRCVINPTVGGADVTIVTVIDETSTDDVVPSAKAVYELFQAVPKYDLSIYAKTADVNKTLEKYALKTEIRAIAEHREYEIMNKPVGTQVDYREKEIRIMIPKGTEFTKQAVGATGNANMYYIPFRAYAPDSDVVSFKESMGSSEITDETMYYFEGNDFAGVDGYGRKYSLCWLAVATYDEATDTWSYFGAKSSAEKYIGWTYRVDWYNADGVVIASDMIRINLSNEDCHYIFNDAMLTEFVTEEEIAGLVDKVDALEDKLIEVSTWAEI